jgi:hypothetical protein
VSFVPVAKARGKGGNDEVFNAAETYRGAVKAVTSKDEYSRFAMSSLDLTEKATDLSNKVGT